MNLQGKRALVTGADGFIGGHLVERLATGGAAVRAFVQRPQQPSEVLGAGEIVAGDICDAYSVRAAMRGVDIVFHLAALSAIPYSFQAPRLYVQTNITGTLHVLQAAHDLGAGRVVYVSSSAVYGAARYLPIDEAHPLQAASPYTASKIGAEKLVEAFYRAFGLPVVIVRPFNIYGPRQSTRAVIPDIIAQCARGDTVHLGRLHPTRDFTYVSDAVAGLLKAAMAPGAPGCAINLCTGREISVLALANLIIRVAGRERAVAVETDTARLRPAGDVDRLVGDNRRARALLGWEPVVSLEEGLATLCAPK